MSTVLECVADVSVVRMTVSHDLRTPAERMTVGKSICEVERRFPNDAVCVCVFVCVCVHVCV
jgi:hypothetical protein